MFLASLLMLIQRETEFQQPAYFGPVVVVMLILGALGWLIAAVLGFARARAFGASAKWFAIAAVCLFLFHVQFLGLAFGLIIQDLNLVFKLLTFFNLFVLLASVCAIIGFIRLTSPR